MLSSKVSKDLAEKPEVAILESLTFNDGLSSVFMHAVTPDNRTRVYIVFTALLIRRPFMLKARLGLLLTA